MRTRDLHLDMLDYGSSGVEIRQSGVSLSKADLAYRVRVANDGTKARAVLVRVRLKAGDRTVLELHSRIKAAPGAVAVADLSGALLSPHLWDGVADPYLYASEVSIEDAATGAVLDQAEIKTGIRSVVLTPDRGLLLNGHPYGVHGVNIHQSMRPGRGPAVGEAEIDADFRMLRELGVTGLRFAHYQHPQRDYDLADQDGVLVWTEVPFVAKAVADTAFGDNLQDQLRELIRQNINHPSVFVWGWAMKSIMSMRPARTGLSACKPSPTPKTRTGRPPTPIAARRSTDRRPAIPTRSAPMSIMAGTTVSSMIWGPGWTPITPKGPRRLRRSANMAQAAARSIRKTRRNVRARIRIGIRSSIRRFTMSGPGLRSRNAAGYGPALSGAASIFPRTAAMRAIMRASMTRG
ncbi:MAG TPA: glycoside hydrolase family 2 TIM barrel-domain containing protein [Asticcacaulis sp.]|nr:glycoside hydrolase family 2 TIM barrel-domain containing protein [Asticcacaulis sp.]